MSEQSEALVVIPPASTVGPGSLPAGVRQLAYAWVGLWGVASEDLGSFYQRCVARGEQIMNPKSPAARPEVNSPMSGATMTEPKKPTSRVIRPLSVFNAFGAVKSYHIDLNAEGLVPTKQDLDALSERVEALAREVDALVQQPKQAQ